MAVLRATHIKSVIDGFYHYCIIGCLRVNTSDIESLLLLRYNLKNLYPKINEFCKSNKRCLLLKSNLLVVLNNTVYAQSMTIEKLSDYEAPSVDAAMY
jgi:hypothetical protein